MEKDEKGKTNRSAFGQPYQKIRHIAVLPDGTKAEPMGSGTITGILGIGGMANVYEIWNPQLELYRAVKLLHPNYTPEIKQRFQTEIKITAKLHHPNIVEIHGVGQWQGLPYIEMERIKGHTLEQLIDDRGALPIEVCISIGIMIGRALRYAHNQEYELYGKKYHGVIHRDLKTSNIMVDMDGNVKLMDFGIARPTDASIHTTDGSILGTMQYLSPEQLDGKDVDIRTDVYSLGTIMYEMITGVKAFPDHNISRLMLAKVKNDFKQLDQYDIRIPGRLRKLIHRCMIYDREKRVQNTTAFLYELGRIHKAITPLSPEQVMQQFLNVPGVERIIIRIRNKIPVAMICATAAMVVIGTFILVGTLTNKISREKKSVMVEPETTVVPPIRDGNLAVSEQETINNGVDVVKEKKLDKHAFEKDGADVPAKANAAEPMKKEPSKTEGGKVQIPPSKRTPTEKENIELVEKKMAQQQFTEALEIMKRLDPEQQKSPKGIIYTMRLLKTLHKNTQLWHLLSTNELHDGEFYLQKARQALKRDDLKKTKKYVDLSLSTPGAFVTSQELRLESLHCKAMYRTRKFVLDPTPETERMALDSWFEVKAYLQTSKEHPYFKFADVQMQGVVAQAETLISEKDNR